MIRNGEICVPKRVLPTERKNFLMYPWAELNHHFVLRTDLFYPLNYRGSWWTYGELNPDPCHAMAMFCR